MHHRKEDTAIIRFPQFYIYFKPQLNIAGAEALQAQKCHVTLMSVAVTLAGLKKFASRQILI